MRTQRLSIREQIFILKQLSYLLGAGVPLLESISTLRTQSGRKPTRVLLEKMEQDVHQGTSLSKSMRLQSHMFPAIVPALIHVGEESGTLPQSLAFIAEELRKKSVLKKKIIGALIYPLIVTAATFGIVGMLTFFIFPKIIPVFISMRVPLPLTTRIMLGVSTFLQMYWAYLLLCIVLFCALSLLVYTKLPFVRYACATLHAHIPIVGKLSHGYTMTNIYRTLGLLLTNGMPVTEAIHVTQTTLSNPRYQDACNALHLHMISGKKLSYGMTEITRIFSPTAIQMVSVGEQTGNLAATLTYLGEMYESDLEDTTKNLSNAVEPVLMILMGLLVGFIALSIVTPIYEITQHLKTH